MIEAIGNAPDDAEGPVIDGFILELLPAFTLAFAVPPTGAARCA